MKEELKQPSCQTILDGWNKFYLLGKFWKKKQKQIHRFGYILAFTVLKQRKSKYLFYFISVMKKFCIWEETKGKDIWFVFYFVKNLIQISGTVSQDFVGPFS